MSGRTKCETCCGWYASGYTRCPECAPAPTPDAVAQARENALEVAHAYRRGDVVSRDVTDAIDALIAAARAECAAKVLKLWRWEPEEDGGMVTDHEHGTYLDREAVLRALEAQP